ncbi:hypothetical protein MSG28_013734 [Choristoneura fumiferana]|uniref:Uncharacterized protein n=2 Tax=Choristoneura fumiferana TaxID=7141 RepID=A0ACC0K940_CHOFU|nr:hypothetical protein MSG28_013734 [Choristoneura fumiferana]
MNTDEEDVLSVLAVMDLIQRSQNRNRFRVRPYLKQRSFNIYQELQVEDRFGLKNFFRCSESDFEELLLLILPDIQKKTTWRNDVIPPDMRLGATLRYLATGDSYTSLMYQLRISKQQLSELVPEVCMALYKSLKNLYLKMPSTEAEWRRISAGFNSRWNFPHGIGALDGKHVIMEAPANTGSLYYNYKKTFSIVLLAMADYDYNFIYIDVGSQGRISDGGVFQNSSLSRALNSNTLGLPTDEPLPGEEVNLPYVILADAAFPLSHHIMKPYSGDHEQGSPERIFNYRLSRARRIIENTFGILASVFRVFKKPLTVEVKTAISVILASVVLHNYLRRNNISRNLYSPQGTFDTEENGNLIPGQWRTEAQMEGLQPLPRLPRRTAVDSQRIRDNFASYFVSERGMVPWQY